MAQEAAEVAGLAEGEGQQEQMASEVPGGLKAADEAVTAA